MRDVGELGIRWFDDPPPGPPTGSELAAFEKKFGVKLPEDYLAFLRRANGGSPTLRRFNADGEEWSIEEFYRLAPPRLPTREDVGLAADDEFDFGNLWHETEDLRERVGGRLVPIASDAFGNIFALDCRASSAPVVVVDFGDNRRQRHIADAFSEFLSLLH